MRFSIGDPPAKPAKQKKTSSPWKIIEITHSQNSGRGSRSGVIIILHKLFSSNFLILSPDVPWRRSPPEIAARWRYRLPSNNLTAHYNSQFFVSFLFGFDQEAHKCLSTCLNLALTYFSSFQIFMWVSSYTYLVLCPSLACWKKDFNGISISTFPPWYAFQMIWHLDWFSLYVAMSVIGKNLWNSCVSVSVKKPTILCYLSTHCHLSWSSRYNLLCLKFSPP